MLKRRGGRHRPPTTSTNKRPRVQPAEPASRLLQENVDVFAWQSAADLPARERAALAVDTLRN